MYVHRKVPHTQRGLAVRGGCSCGRCVIDEDREGQEKRWGTRGEAFQRTRGMREAMRVSGTRGKLIHVCQGQRVGFRSAGRQRGVGR
jgi:hypothetical protein